jgi:histone-lysine N-methyltransferase SETD7
MTADRKSPCGSNIGYGSLSFIGRFSNGVAQGACWQGLVGGAWLHGVVDDFGDFTGNDMAYVYQDLKTAFRGRFEKGVMVSN